jgi:predicted nuclease with TOPRIM domain
LEERISQLESEKKELIENQKLIESEIETVKKKIEELKSTANK